MEPVKSYKDFANIPIDTCLLFSHSKLLEECDPEDVLKAKADAMHFSSYTDEMPWGNILQTLVKSGRRNKGALRSAHSHRQPRSN